MKVHIKPTMRCNLACYYCNEKRDGKEMTITTVASIIEAVAGAVQSRGARSVEFEWSGGEPLLMGPKFFRTVFRLQRQLIGANLYNTIYSNLLLLDQEMADLLGNERATVYTSLDDLGENRLRLGVTSRYFETFDSRLSLLLQRGLKVKLYMTVTDDNVGALGKVYRYALQRELDFDFANVQQPFNEPIVRLRALAPAPTAFQSQSIALFEEWYSGASTRTVVKPFYAVLQFLVNHTRPKPTALISFDADGHVYVCPFDISKRRPAYHANQLATVNLGELSARACQGSAAVHSECMDCPFSEFCNLMLCKDASETISVAPGLALANTCKYWKPVFEHIHRRVRLDLEGRNARSFAGAAL